MKSNTVRILGLATAFFASVTVTSAGNPELSVERALMPVYPACAIEQRVQGFVTIRASLNADGAVIRAVPIRNGEPIVFPEAKTDSQFGYACLCKAAQTAAMNWRFAHKPAEFVDLRFNFVLLGGIPQGENLGAMYRPPVDVEVRGLLPSVVITTSDPIDVAK